MGDIILIIALLLLLIALLAFILIRDIKIYLRVKRMRRGYPKIQRCGRIEQAIVYLGSPTSVGRDAEGRDIYKWEITDPSFIKVHRMIEVTVKDGRIVSYNSQSLNDFFWW